MASKWSNNSQQYITELRELGKLLSRHPSLSKCKNYQNVIEFGHGLFNQAKDAIGSRNGKAVLSTEPSLIFEAQSNKVHPGKGRAQIAVGGESSFSDGLLSFQSVNLLIFFTPEVKLENLEANRTYIVRKIHFDFDRNNLGKNKPTSHLQVGGKVTCKMLEHSNDPSHVVRESFEQIDLPRIPSPPLSLASVVDLALREFATTELQTFTEENTWNELVSRTETLLLSAYHNSLHTELQNRASTRTNYAYHCDNVVCDV